MTTRGRRWYQRLLGGKARRVRGGYRPSVEALGIAFIACVRYLSPNAVKCSGA